MKRSRADQGSNRCLDLRRSRPNQSLGQSVAAMLFPLYDLNPHHRFPLLTLLIIAINMATMGWVSTLNSDRASSVVFRYGFIPVRASDIGSGQPVNIPVPQVNRWGQVLPHAQPRIIRLPTDERSVYLTFLTTMCLHGGWMHLLFNMWTLWIFGNNIEDRLGHVLYVCFYLLGGMAGTLCHWAIAPHSTIPVVGASGAIAAVLGGYALTFPTAKIRTLVFVFLIWIVDIPALIFLGIWFLLQVFSGLNLFGGGANQPVAFWAHAGGFVAGLMLMPLLSLGVAPPGTDWQKEAEELFRFDDPRSP